MATTRRWVAASAISALALTGLVAAPAAAAEPQTLAVDFADRTGEFRGGATGTLYGLGDSGVPSEALLNGAHVTNTSQKAPYGTQHPSGDAIKVEDDFFAKHGEDMYIYVQDYYPDWSYNGGQRPGDSRTYNLANGTYTNQANGVWDYLEIVEFVADAVAEDSSYPQDYIFIPFNEPDGGNWYPNWANQKTQFLADWQATYDKIQQVWAEHGLGHARIGGGGDTRWQPQRTADILAYTNAHDSLPDIFIWHELGIDNLAWYRQNFADYRALESSLGIDPIPVNITEYGMLRDMGVPGQLVQWLAMFEETKVDAQVAYWNYAGNLSDNSARPNGANAGWWMFKWYGDLEGSETVAVTPPTPSGVDTLQGIGAIDEVNRRATVLWGGTDEDVALDLSGLDASLFGEAVDVEVREAPLSGAEGLANTPRVVIAEDNVPLTDGTLDLAVPTYDRYAGYQIIITPAQSRDVEADAAVQPWSASIEAENMQLTAASAFTQDPKAGGGWKFLASGGRDVGAMNRATSKADWTVDIPAAGTYRLQVVGGAPGVPGRHALFVDGVAAGTIQYTADLALNATSRWQYRGSAEVLVEIPAGSHTLSIRTSANGTSVLPNSDITLDKVSLTAVGGGERTVYPATEFRLFGGATLSWSGESAGSAALSGDQRADLYVTAMDSGYYDLAVDWATDAAGATEVALNGQGVATLTANAAGSWRSTVRAHLVEGINEIELRSDSGAKIAQLATTRVRNADTAAVSIEAEQAQRSGAASVSTLAVSTGTNASGGAYVGFIGNGAQNTLQIPRGAGFNTAGDYDVTVFYSNAELVGNHAYNPQVVDRRLDVFEGTGKVGDGHFRYTYSWNSFWQRTIPVTLTTGDQPLKFANANAYAPNIDRIVISPRVIGTPTTADLTPPVVTIAAEPGEPTGDSGWYTDAVTVTASATDNSSGVASIEVSVDDGAWTAYTGPLAAPEGKTTYRFRATDVAGNVAGTQTITVHRDTTAPGVTWAGDLTADSTHTFGAVPAAPTCEAGDALSGEAGCDVTGYSSEVGTHTLTATARDVAGNTTTETRTYTVAPWTLTGFTSPVDMNGVFNVVKSGSTVPLRFEVFAGNEELTTVDAISGLRTQQTSCLAGAVVDDIETTVAGGTQVSYDTDAGRFQYNWKTPKGSTGCVKLIVETADGSELTALFRLK